MPTAVGAAGVGVRSEVGLCTRIGCGPLVGQRCLRGFREVSAANSTAVRDTAAAATRYQPGASLLCVKPMSRVAMNGAEPPNSALERLKLTAKPLYRTLVGKSSARRLGSVL